MRALIRMLAVALVTVITHAYIPDSTFETDRLATYSLTRLVESVESGQLQEALATRGVQHSCTLSKLAVRRE